MMTIGAFAERSRLSPKALRLYDRLGLLTPARTDAGSGYRFYAEDQVEQARLIGLLRRIDLPLPAIAEMLTSPPTRPPTRSAGTGPVSEAATAERRALVSYIQARLRGDTMPSYTVQTRDIPVRTVAAINRHVHVDETDSFFADAFARLRAAGDGLAGVGGLPYLVFYGEVSQDSDGPVELCRPIATPVDDARPSARPNLDVRVEAAHEEAYIRLAKRDMGWPALLPAYDALEAWSAEHDRQPAGPPRQVLVADQRTASPDTPVCDLSLPLKPDRGPRWTGPGSRRRGGRTGDTRPPGGGGDLDESPRHRPPPHRATIGQCGVAHPRRTGTGVRGAGRSGDHDQGLVHAQHRSDGRGRVPLHWAWEMYGASSDIQVEEIQVDRRIRFTWSGYRPEHPTTVEFVLAPFDDGTLLAVTERGFTGTGDELVRFVTDSTGGFTFLLCSLKALLEHDVDLRVVRDAHPRAWRT